MYWYGCTSDRRRRAFSRHHHVNPKMPKGSSAPFISLKGVVFRMCPAIEKQHLPHLYNIFLENKKQKTKTTSSWKRPSVLGGYRKRASSLCLHTRSNGRQTGSADTKTPRQTCRNARRIYYDSGRLRGTSKIAVYPQILLISRSANYCCVQTKPRPDTTTTCIHSLKRSFQRENLDLCYRYLLIISCKGWQD